MAKYRHFMPADKPKCAMAQPMSEEAAVDRDGPGLRIGPDDHPREPVCRIPGQRAIQPPSTVTTDPVT